MRKITIIAAASIAALAIPTLAIAGSSTPNATGNVTWDYQGKVTGSVIFNANKKTGGSLDYQNSAGQWLHGVVTDVRVDGNKAVFVGTVTAGSPEYTDYTDSDVFYAKVVGGGTSGSNGDQIAVLANEPGFNGVDRINAEYEGDFGAVTGGNLVVH